MTNPSIPPCPVCGTVPTESSANFEYAFGVGDLFVGCCGREKNGVKAIYQRHNWQAVGDNTLGRALRTHGIHTIQQLTERLAPDPRVAVLEAENEAMKARVRKMIPLFSTDGSYNGEIIQGRLWTVIDAANEASKLIAAQRGEG